jgi:hypothetical protein
MNNNKIKIPIQGKNRYIIPGTAILNIKVTIDNARKVVIDAKPSLLDQILTNIFLNLSINYS